MFSRVQIWYWGCSSLRWNMMAFWFFEDWWYRYISIDNSRSYFLTFFEVISPQKCIISGAKICTTTSSNPSFPYTRTLTCYKYVQTERLVQVSKDPPMPDPIRPIHRLPTLSPYLCSPIPIPTLWSYARSTHLRKPRRPIPTMPDDRHDVFDGRG